MRKRMRPFPWRAALWYVVTDFYLTVTGPCALSGRPSLSVYKSYSMKHVSAIIKSIILCRCSR